MDDETLLLIGLGAAALLYFGSDIKRITGAAANVVEKVTNIPEVAAQNTTNQENYWKQFWGGLFNTNYPLINL